MSTETNAEPLHKPNALGWWWVWHNKTWWPCRVVGDGEDPHFWTMVIFGQSWGPTLHARVPGMLWYRAALPPEPDKTAET